MLTSVWEEREVPTEWMDAGIIHIPKKGNLSNNWRGITFLEVVGKVAARVGCRDWQRENYQIHTVVLERVTLALI